MLNGNKEVGDFIPDGPHKTEIHYSKVTIQAHKKNWVVILISAVDFYMKPPSNFRNVKWIHYDEYTELHFFIDPSLFETDALAFAQAINLII